MSNLYTRDGVPLAIRGDRVYNNDGDHFGYVKGDKVYGIDGDYRGTITSGDRLVYRSTQSATRAGSRGRSASIGGVSRAHRAGSAIWGDEPNTEP